MSQSHKKIAVGKQARAREVALTKIAEFVVDGSVCIGDILSWKENGQFWPILSKILILDLCTEVNRLLLLAENSTTEEPSQEKVSMKTTPSVPSENTKTEREPKMSENNQSQSPSVDQLCTQILNLEGFKNPGDKMSKKDIASSLSLSEDDVNEGLQALKSQSKVKSNRGRNAKWERTA